MIHLAHCAGDCDNLLVQLWQDLFRPEEHRELILWWRCGTGKDQNQPKNALYGQIQQDIINV
jgi:hypothetical protein